MHVGFDTFATIQVYDLKGDAGWLQQYLCQCVDSSILDLGIDRHDAGRAVLFDAPWEHERRKELGSGLDPCCCELLCDVSCISPMVECT